MNNNPYSADQNPDLSLAQSPPIPDVASGSPVAIMPTYQPPIPRPLPELKPFDIGCMGVVGEMPDLNLAGCDPLPAPPYEDNSDGAMSANDPTYGAPDFSVPPLHGFDLVEPGIDHIEEFEPDPHAGDLLAYDKPMGIDIMTAMGTPMAPDPDVPDLETYDRPSDLEMRDPMTVDPSLPDLQDPTLTQETHMPDRPGEMGDGDGDEGEHGLDLGPDGDNDDDDGPMPPYKENYMTPGMTHRQRKMDMVYRGLKGSLYDA